MKYTHEASVPLPLSAIHLDKWIFGMTEQEYMACARGHRAIGMLGCPERTGMVNVESMAGSLIVQHYTTQLLEPHHVRFFSGASRAYLLHLLPFRLSVSWEMEATSVSSEASQLRCTINVRLPWWVRIIGVFNATGFWIRRHLIEETGGFARNLIARAGG